MALVESHPSGREMEEFGRGGGLEDSQLPK